MLELCFNEGVGGLLTYWQSGKQKILCLGDDLSIGRLPEGWTARSAGISWCGFSVLTPGASFLLGSGSTKPGSAIAGPGSACAPSLSEPRCGSGWTGPRAAGAGSWRQLKPWPSARPV